MKKLKTCDLNRHNIVARFLLPLYSEKKSGSLYQFYKCFKYEV
jgi:hypothetical protein